ncbi:MAG TPA: hypothetical protein VFF27_10885 [Bacteroidia bacterium]|nr:hypothetical protein [Bacteroidia bacterium]
MDFLKKNKWLIGIICLVLISPIVSHLLWMLKPVSALDIIIVDKTVSDTQKNEHASLTWLLNNLKIVKKENKELYSIDNYYGFFPRNNEKFDINDFEKRSEPELRELSSEHEMVYITDSYGVYSNEWYHHEQISERSNLIYGGLTTKDISLLERFKSEKKLIVTEFNCIGSPTSKQVRGRFEELFQLKWTGWIGRYFDNLSVKNVDIPRWLINNYKKQHQDKWEFKKSGIAFVNENDQIEILEEGKDLVSAIPTIHTNEEQMKRFGIPKMVNYPYWFDILKIENTNVPVSLYHIETTPNGDRIMNTNGILKTFPAIIEHNAEDYKFYYFAGDFADNKISTKLSQYVGVPWIKSTLSSFHEGDKENFYWNYYYPLMSKIIKDYYNTLPEEAN